MKKLPFCICFLLLTCSCTRVLFTTDQVLGTYQTDKSVMARFGIPSKKIDRPMGLTEWVYEYGERSIGINDTYISGMGWSNTTTGGYTYGSGSATITNVSASTNYMRNITFVINKDGKVLNHFYSGVNLDVIGKNKGGTFLLAGAASAIILVMYATTVGF